MYDIVDSLLIFSKQVLRAVICIKKVATPPPICIVITDIKIEKISGKKDKIF